MPSDPSDHVPGHARRRSASGDGVAFVPFVKVDIPPAQPPGGDPPALSEELVRVAEMALLDIANEPGPIREFPFVTVLVGGELDAWALAEGDGIRLGVARSGTPADVITGVLLRYAPEPHGGLFTVSGRGADGSMACNGSVAAYVVGNALGRMFDEILSVERSYGPARAPGTSASLFDQAFPRWEPLAEVSADPEDAPLGPSMT